MVRLRVRPIFVASLEEKLARAPDVLTWHQEIDVNERSQGHIRVPRLCQGGALQGEAGDPFALQDGEHFVSLTKCQGPPDHICAPERREISRSPGGDW